MYIDKLTVKDIASLRGEHTVDFKNMLAKEGLFAITGPTGSGKSTLLSAISLALYGQGAKKGLAAKDYVSEGAASGEVDLTFSIDGKSYRAFWSCAVLKKDGTPRAKPVTKSYIEDLHSSQVLEVGASELIKLTLDQFNQCVVLHQGEFAKFLTSTFSERRVILEKLVNISELEQLKESFVSKYHTLDKEIAALREKASSSEIFTKEEHEELLKKRKSSELTYQNVCAQLTGVEGIGRLLEKIIEYKKIIDETTVKEKAALTTLETSTKEYQESFETYHALEASKRNQEEEWQKERPGILGGIEKKRQIEQQQTEIKRERSEIEEIKERSSALKQKKSSLEIEHKTISFEWPLEKRQLLEIRGEELLREIDEISNNRDLHSKLIAEHDTYQAQMADLMGQANELKSRHHLLADDEVSAKKTEQKTLELSAETLTQERIKQEGRLKRVTELFTKYQEKHASITQSQQSTRASQALESEIAKKEEGLADRQLLLAQYETIESLWKKTLEQGTCQLCGSDHPSTPHLSLEGKDKLIQEVQKVKAELLTLKQELNSSKENENKLSLLKTECERLALEIAELKEEDELAHEGEKLTSNINLKIEGIKEQLKELADKKAQLELLLSEDQRAKNALTGFREQYARSKENSILTLQKTKELDQLCTELLKKNPFTENFEKLSESVAPLRAKLYKEISLIQKEKHLKSTLEETKAQLLKDSERTEQREKKVCELEGVITTLRSQIPEAHRELDLGHYLERKDEEIKQKRDELWSLGQALNEKKLACERAREAIGHIRENLKSAHEWLAKHSDEYAKTSKEASTHFKSEDAVLKFVADHLDFEHMGHEQINTLYQAEFLPLKKVLQHKKESSHTEYVQIKSKLDLYDKKLKEAQALTKKLKQLEEKFALMNSMKDFFWRNDFKNFVLSMIEEELIFITNDELTKLCEGRYQLSSRPSANGPEFVVIDKWISLTERKVASLSGGETFMVSLALALGLAEMTRGKTQIDSFFIDEGFGSLDSETLDSVTEVLLGLRGRGKTIGVISHVEALTARLPRSLILSKHTGGQSTLAYQELV